jgi:hypothetical protein
MKPDPSALADQFLDAYDACNHDDGKALEALRKKYGTGTQVLAGLFQWFAEHA